MKQILVRPLGHSGLEVSVVGLGCNQFGRRLDLGQTRQVIDAAADAGITFLDTADLYGGTRSEEFIGEALKGRRDRFVIGTKFGQDTGDGWDGPRGSPDYIRHAVEASLRRLQTDYIDVYWYHKPDGVTPIAQTIAALDELVRSGTVRAIGASKVTAEMIQDADTAARENGLSRFTAIQNEYSLFERAAEADVLPLCERLDLAFIPYYPLAKGLLSGQYRRDAPAPVGARLAAQDEIATDQQWTLVERLTGFADARGVTLAALAIGALLAEHAVASVIAGASKPEQAHANATAADWIPDRAELAELRAVLAETG
jgi:aryl-alcohol dehydrogenase-like predicted oxidoreductase